LPLHDTEPMDAPLWSEAAPPARPPLVEEVRADVCVVGLGGSGLTAVEQLREAGATVVGLDAGAIGGGAAGRNGGFLLAGLAHPHHEAARELGPVATQIHRLTLDELDRVAARTPDAVRRTGSLRVEDTEEGLEDCIAQRGSLRASGLRVEDYEGPEGRGLLFPDDAVMHPMRRLADLAAGVPDLYEQSFVRSVSAGLVETDHGTVRCGAVVVAVDGRLEQLLPELAGRVRTVRLQMLGTAPTDEVSHPRPVYLRYGFEYWQQLPDGRLAVGGFRDRGGDEEETPSSAPSAVVQQAIEDLVRTRIGVSAPITHRWAASVGFTPDGLPFVGEVRPGVWAAGGYCGTGNLIGALCGRAMASAVTGGDPSSYWPLL
jgi:gamma-glutamylputrescine oxidase